MNGSRKNILSLVDCIASEYGWTLGYILSLPSDVLLDLYMVILERKKKEYILLSKVIAAAYACAKTGKMNKLDNLFSENTDSDKGADVGALYNLWLAAHPNKDPKEFEKQLKEGKVII